MNIKKLLFFDAKDLMVFGGIGSIGYGLYQFMPWVSFVVTGLLLMLIGLFYRGPVK